MVKEQILSDTLVRHYSDQGLMLRQVETGKEYNEVVDVIPCRYTYEETHKHIKVDSLEDMRQALAVLGVSK